MTRRQVELTSADQDYLEKLLSRGVSKARVFKRATGLLELHRGKGVEAVVATLGVCRRSVARWKQAYKQSGLRFLEDAPRSGRPIQIDGRQRAKVTALACSQAPEGHARWSLRLLADKVVELGYCEQISHTEVVKILKATWSSPISRKPGAWGR